VARFAGPHPVYRNDFFEGYHQAVIMATPAAVGLVEGNPSLYWHHMENTWNRDPIKRLVTGLQLRCPKVGWPELCGQLYEHFAAWYQEQLGPAPAGLMYQGFVQRTAADDVMYLSGYHGIPFHLSPDFAGVPSVSAPEAFDFLMASRDRLQLGTAQWRLLVRPQHALDHVRANTIGWNKRTETHLVIDRRPVLNHMMEQLSAALSTKNISDLCKMHTG
jgi:hypothetical protein